ncbi:MAG: ThuA domain-containing protein [Bacteroidia bacterium]|nr:ThuA domain-containing protein [Bacteroidia bacterium]
MNHLRLFSGLIVILTLLTCSQSTSPDLPPDVPDDAALNVLVFSRTNGFRHKSIEPGVEAFKKLGAAQNWTLSFSEDSTIFTSDHLKNYQVVVFLNTTGNILNTSQETAFENYIKNGGGFVGIHSATDTEYDWDFYGRLIGAYFASHPQVQEATVRIKNAQHPATEQVPNVWQKIDEWYNFKKPVADYVNVLAEVDESTYQGG